MRCWHTVRYDSVRFVSPNLLVTAGAYRHIADMTSASSSEISKQDTVRKPKTEIGWCELIDLPDFGISNLHAKIDTGAATSSLHATAIEPFGKDGQDYVRFIIPTGAGTADHRCEAKVYGRRRIRSSNGVMQERYVIETGLRLGPLSWTGHMTLANRQSMIFPVLMGRRALRRGFLVNSGRRWMLGAHTERKI